MMMKPNCPSCKINFWTVASPNPLYKWYCNQCYGAWNEENKVQPPTNYEEVEATKKLLDEMIKKAKDQIDIKTAEVRAAEKALEIALDNQAKAWTSWRNMCKTQNTFNEMLAAYDKMDEKFVKLQCEIEDIYNKEIKK